MGTVMSFTPLTPQQLARATEAPDRAEELLDASYDHDGEDGIEPEAFDGYLDAVRLSGRPRRGGAAPRCRTAAAGADRGPRRGRALRPSAAPALSAPGGRGARPPATRP
ncbi:hypothetical protein GCM10010495_47900 [Kitasatospora herbaricolor]|nr:hypothetical protein GCM10010495_47900 [Kitasatospora herbaricolor]